MNKKARKLPILMLITFVVSFSHGGMKQPCGDSIPIIYSPDYNISILGIENFHPFDSKKYRKVYKGIIQGQKICRSQIYQPQIVTDAELLTVHTDEYLASLKKSKVIARIAEILPLRILPTFILRNGILKPMKLATGGTILGAQLALRYGWSINLSGGYHHAKSANGEGFCVFADVPIALKSIWERKKDLKILIVDLDAHQGNGNSSILGNDHRVAILDMYNSAIYPNDIKAAEMVKYRIPLNHHTNTKEYLRHLSNWLPKAINEFQPGLIVYIAGTDIFVEDRLGNLSVTEDGIIKRDAFVFRKAIENRIPILMVLSGGYNKKSGGIIAKSINNLLQMNELRPALKKEEEPPQQTNNSASTPYQP